MQLTQVFYSEVCQSKCHSSASWSVYQQMCRFMSCSHLCKKTCLLRLKQCSMPLQSSSLVQVAWCEEAVRKPLWDQQEVHDERSFVLVPNVCDMASPSWWCSGYLLHDCPTHQWSNNTLYTLAAFQLYSSYWIDDSDSWYYGASFSCQQQALYIVGWYLFKLHNNTAFRLNNLTTFYIPYPSCM